MFLAKPSSPPIQTISTLLHLPPPWHLNSSIDQLELFLIKQTRLSLTVRLAGDKVGCKVGWLPGLAHHALVIHQGLPGGAAPAVIMP